MASAGTRSGGGFPVDFPLRSGHKARLCSAYTDVTAYTDLAATASLIPAAAVVCSE